MDHTTPLLDTIHTPQDVRKLAPEQLKPLAEEVRQDMIRAVACTGGHLGAGLGVVELTLALHYVFDTPRDQLIWDVGHQAYPHKMLTGRRERLRTIRQPGGLSGFCKRDESPYDAFGAGHSSTSISAGLGMAVARDLARQQDPAHADHHVLAVIGDGAMSAGMAFEALNNAGALGSRLIVILNDNDMSIAPPVGAMSQYLARLISSRGYRSFRHKARAVAEKLPEAVARAARKAEHYVRGMASPDKPLGGTLFEELGFYYVGPMDGHNLDQLLAVLTNLRDDPEGGPVLVHVVTRKGKGYAPAEAAADKYHGVAAFDVATGAQQKKPASAPSYTSVFAQSLIREAARDARIVAITAAMPSGTGVDAFAARFADRAFDVGIAEQHAVTFAAGMATQGFKPFVAIYSTFLQRAYDQVVHDVATQKLPVRFAIDRAGLVGADGATHAGSFDIAMMACLPNFVLMAAADEAELSRMVATAAALDDRPCAFRYPRGEGTGAALGADSATPLEIGKGRILREGGEVAILSYGTRLTEALLAADMLGQQGVSVTVADARFAKPLDTDLIGQLVRHHRVLITMEEGAAGGFGAQVLQYLSNSGLLDAQPGQQPCRVRTLTLPDTFQPHDTPTAQYATAALDASAVVRTVAQAMGGLPDAAAASAAFAAA